MDIQSISGAATIATFCAIAFLIAARSWQALSRVFTSHPSFADSIMSEAAQRFRNRLQQLSREQAINIGAGIVFFLIYLAASVFEGPGLFAGYPDWQLYLLISALALAAAFALYRVVRNYLDWRQVSLQRDANIAIGHQLQRLANSQGQSYHDIPTSAGVVDHVLIGHGGIYAVSVVAKRARKGGECRIDGNELHFSTGKHAMSIVDLAACSNRLQKELQHLASSVIRVRTVIAVPGWDIPEQRSSKYLLVNERTLPILTGWRTEEDFLLNEDLDALQRYLTERCKISAA